MAGDVDAISVPDERLDVADDFVVDLVALLTIVIEKVLVETTVDANLVAEPPAQFTGQQPWSAHADQLRPQVHPPVIHVAGAPEGDDYSLIQFVLENTIHAFPIRVQRVEHLHEELVLPALALDLLQPLDERQVVGSDQAEPLQFLRLARELVVDLIEGKAAAAVELPDVEPAVLVLVHDLPGNLQRTIVRPRLLDDVGERVDERG
mmetsp:Transcript_41706/g.88878  ORF Transcript_41706/g.88878 Transcript_41706/m.88878 type:complete len:206 (+) Transcript_41706:1040-1657(+)